MIRSLWMLMLLCTACSKQQVPPTPEPPPAKTLSIKAVDASMIPEIRTYALPFKNSSGQAEDMLTTLKNAGVNTIRIRLWKDPAYSYSGYEAVKAFAQEVKSKGMKVWLTVHYSDTWADPGAQAKPAAWSTATFSELKDSVYAYTNQVATGIQPDYIQIGNEINGGLLWPEGSYSNMPQFKALLQEGIRATRTASPATKIMLHYAGVDNAASFFNNFTGLDYDLIGLSYYPIWHGKDLNLVQTTMNSLGTQFNKEVLIAETAYPFTFDWKDYTNNILGLSDQILSAYPASSQGQLDFLKRLKAMVTAAPKGAGICYWGAEWVAFRGNTATNGSSWENQALWDFNFQALPAMDFYKD